MEYSTRHASFIGSADSTSSSTVGTGLSIVCGFVGTYLYWLYLIFISRVMNPVSISVVGKTGLHLAAGQTGSLVTTLDWSGVGLAVLLSLCVFVLTALVANAAVKTLISARRLVPAVV